MKTLILAQHAEALNTNGSSKDIDRLLTQEGLEKAYSVSKRVSQYIKECSAESVKLHSSPAMRALLEAQILASMLGKNNNDISITNLLYQDNAKLIKGALNYVVNSKEDVTTIVSHIPTVPILIYALTRHNTDEILNEDLDTYYSSNPFDINGYMQSGEVDFVKGNAYILKFSNNKAHFDGVIR